MLCGKSFCPRVETAKQYMKTVKVSEQMQAPSPSVFVGRVGYPSIYAGPMLTDYDQPELLGQPEKWYGTPLDSLVNMRYQLVRSKDGMNVFSARNPNRHLIDVQDIAMSKKSVLTEAFFKKKPSFNRRSFNEITAPYGPSGTITKIDLGENPKVPGKVDRIVSDELKAVQGVGKLYEKKIPVSKISNIFSVGLLGETKAKRMVPTRWSITATDDTVGKKLISEVKDFDEVNDYELYSSTYLGNHFEVLLVPGKWSFEQIEVYVPGSIWVDQDQPLRFMKDWEPYSGRTKYAYEVAGGYYAGRLGVLEQLSKRKRQATAIIVREITPEYWCPVGVWEVRENVRAAMKNEVMKFDSLEKALDEIAERCTIKKAWQKESKLLSRIRSREILKSYMLN